MHEWSLVNALLRQVEDLAAEHPGIHVVSIQLRIGEFSGVEPELLVSAYEQLVVDSPLCGAALDLERVPLEALCEQCGSRFRIEQFRFECDNCRSVKLSIQSGEELLLQSVTLEETEP